MDTYTWLRRGLRHLRNEEGNHLLLARIVITSNLVSPEMWAGSRPASRGGEGWFGREFRYVRQHWGNQLREWARLCGAVGGLLVHQVGPHGKAGEPPGYLHDLAVLAEVPTATTRQRAVLEQGSGIGTGRRPFFSSAAREVPGVPILAAAMPAEHPQALCYLWAGTSARFAPDRGGIATNGSIAGDWGFDGAVRLLPWFLFTREQWLVYLEEIRGQHLSVPFGSWREALRRPATPTPRSRSAASGSARRRAAFRTQNLANADQALNRRNEALALARPVYEELSRSSVRRVGRGQLIAAMERAGHPIEERVARDLIPILRVEFPDRAHDRER